MTRGRKIALIGAGVVAAAVAIGAVVGTIGIGQTVTAGTQSTVCGVTVGVSVSGQTVRLLGASDETLSPGDRVRVSPVCVIEIVSIDDGGSATDDGGGRVQLRWRLW